MGRPEDICYLTDRGIRQALERGLLRFDPPLEDRQIQPASIDLLFDSIEDVVPLAHLWPSGRYPSWPEANQIPKHSDVTLNTTQKMFWAPSLRFKTELRSSLRRLSGHMQIFGWTRIGPENRVLVEMINPGGININLARGDKIAQLLFYYTFSVFAGLYEAGLKGYEREAEEFSRVAELDHGRLVATNQEAKRLLLEGYFSVSPEARFEKGRLKVHAGKTIQILRENLTVDFSKKQDISDAFEEVRLPYRLMPGEHVVILTRENLGLSKHVGIHFVDHLAFTGRDLSLLTHPLEHVAADLPLWCMPDGWVDPGYKGVFTRQPKTYYPKGVVIKKGDVLGHGTIIFFPTGVERPYGSKELGSHYQNASNVKLTQK